MKICKNCGKEYTGQNKMFCSKECRAEFSKNKKVCPVCHKKFWSPKSSQVVTCSRECETINRARIGKTESNLKILKLAREAAAESPNTGDHNTNVHAKSWGLVSPDGELYEVDNLSKWCRDHADIIPYHDPKVFTRQLYKIKEGKVNSAGGWTLKWWSEENRAREGMPGPKQRAKRTKMSNEERLERKRRHAREYYRRKKEKS